MADRLGIVAGAGELPRRIVEAARALDRPFFVLAFEGIADPDLVEGLPHAWVRLGAASEGLRLLREAGVGELVMAGAVKRPSLASLRPDWRAAKFLARVGLRALGDDGLLRAVIRELEEEGFRVVGVEDFLPQALAGEGVLGRIDPDEAARTDIEHGIRVARILGALDIGQAVVVQHGIVLGVEAAEGTDALIARAQALRRPGGGGVLVKLAKPGQERRADLPTVGLRTVEAVAAAQFAGIAVEARSTVLVEGAVRVAAAVDAAGLFLVGVKAP
jgi:hypothetical protein